MLVSTYKPMRFQFGIFLLLLLLAGCNVTQPRGGKGVPVTSVGQTGSTALPEVKPAKEMSLSAVVKRSAASVAKKAKGEKLNKSMLLYVDRLRNSTRDTIDTEQATTQLHAQLEKTGQFELIPLSRTLFYQQSLEYHQTESVLNPSSAIRLGKQTGADLILYGQVVKKGTSYQLVMTMLDLRSGELLFTDRQSFKN